jgi:hypothetical protein
VNSKSETEICYLCGERLGGATSADHVPPKQLFARAIRRAQHLQLDTLPVHDSCNQAYKRDEEYLVHTLMPFARGSVAGQAIYDDVLQKYRRREKIGLTLGVLREFEPRPSGLVLPGGKVAKRFAGARLQRVAWKIVRGLFFLHQGRVMPADTTTWVSLTAPGETPPAHFLHFMRLPDREQHGRYPGAFAYRFDNFIEAGSNLHYWALLLWDRIIMTVIFHDQCCTCANCARSTVPYRAEKTQAEG